MGRRPVASTPLPRPGRLAARCCRGLTNQGNALLVAAAVLWVACGQPTRDNPADPDGTGEAEMELVAVLPAGTGASAPMRLATLRYQALAIGAGGDTLRHVDGELDRVGTRITATVSGLVPAPVVRLAVDAFDDQGVRTFAGTDSLTAVRSLPRSATVALHRLLGSLEVALQLPPEVDSVRVAIAGDGDSLVHHLSRAHAVAARLDSLPTGGGTGVALLARSAAGTVVLNCGAAVDIRADLVARLSFRVEVGALDVTATFPDYLAVAEVDRFSDAAGHFFRRSEHPDLPAAGQPVDFDRPRFLHRGVGPDGERVVFYVFDVCPAVAPPVYLLVDGRGAPIAAQLPVFDLLPGDTGYSDLWQIHQVAVPDPNYVANTITSRQTLIDSGYVVTPTQALMNAVLVPPGSNAARRFDPATPVTPQNGWYRHQIVKYLLFEHPGSTARAACREGRPVATQMFAFLADDATLGGGFALDATGSTHNVMASLPGNASQADYSPLWLLRVLHLVAFHRVTNLSTAADQLAASGDPAWVDVLVNAPIVAVD